MTLKQLEYVIALDNHRNFVKAADSCYVTQPTLTMQVGKLEEEIGVQIFDRGKKPLKPTKAGTQIIEKARQIIREVNLMREYLSEERETLSGEFKLGIIPTLAPYLLPIFLSEFTKNNKDVKLVIKEMQTEEIIKALHNDTIDIGLLVTPLEEKRIREIKLFNEPFLYYHPEASKLKNEITQNDLDKEGLLLLEEGHCFRNQILNVCKNNEQKGKGSFEFESGSIEALKELVRRNVGFTLIPELSYKEEIDKKYVRRFAKPEPVREVSLVVHNSFTKETLISELRDSILNNIPDSFNKNSNYIKVKWR